MQGRLLIASRWHKHGLGGPLREKCEKDVRRGRRMLNAVRSAIQAPIKEKSKIDEQANRKFHLRNRRTCGRDI